MISLDGLQAPSASSCDIIVYRKFTDVLFSWRICLSGECQFNTDKCRNNTSLFCTDLFMKLIVVAVLQPVVQKKSIESFLKVLINLPSHEFKRTLKICYITPSLLYKMEKNLSIHVQLLMYLMQGWCSVSTTREGD